MKLRDRIHDVIGTDTAVATNVGSNQDSGAAIESTNGSAGLTYAEKLKVTLPPLHDTRQKSANQSDDVRTVTFSRKALSANPNNEVPTTASSKCGCK